MPPANAVIVSFQGGEVAPKSRGRFDLQWYASSCKKLLNYIADFQGPARYRPGFRYVRQTRRGAYARLVPFDLGNGQGYELEFTAGYMRAYQNGDLLYSNIYPVAEMSLLTANTLVLDKAGSLLTNGQEVVLNGFTGAAAFLNGRQFVVANAAGSSSPPVEAQCTLNDPVSGDQVTLPAYTASGNETLSIIYEIEAPVLAGWLDSLQYAGDGSTAQMYFTSPYGGPWKLTVDSNNNFTFGTYTRTDDPFTPLGPAETITGVTQGDPGVITITSPTYNNGDIILISGVVGMTELNGNQYILQGVSGSTYQLTDLLGNNLDTTGYTAYVSGGTAQKILNPAPLQLEGASFVGTTGADGINPPYQHALSVAFAPGSNIIPNTPYTFSGVSGMTQLNGQTFLIASVNLFVPSGAVGLILLNLDGSVFTNPGNWGAYSGGGVANFYSTPFPDVEFPIGVCFYEGRLIFGGTNLRPNSFFMSMGPDTDSGDPQYDVFTGGSNDNNAVFYSLAPINGQVDSISWVRGTPGFLMAGTLGGPYRLTGAGLAQPITPSSISAQQFDSFSCDTEMPAGTSQIFYLQNGGVTVRAPRMTNPYLGIFNVIDMCLNAEQIPNVLGGAAANGVGGLKRLAFQNGRPQILWAVRNDGLLCGLSVQVNAMMEGVDKLAGWHRHSIGGPSAQCLDIISVPRLNNDDQVWAVMQRTNNGETVCTVEYQADDVQFPDLEDFYSAPGNQEADLADFNNAVYRLQEEYVHLDGAMTYDGSVRGIAVGATMSPSAVGVAPVAGSDGSTITLTASYAVFLATDVGNEIWKKPDPVTGLGAGRALITSYISSTEVQATCLTPFDSTEAIAAGDWYFATSTITGAWPLNGQAVAVVADGGVISDGGLTPGAYPVITVVNGAFTLPHNQAVVHAGYPYLGLGKTQNLEMGGKTGPAQTKPRNIVEMYIRFLNSLGTNYGTDQYHMEQINHRKGTDPYDRPTPVFSGIKKLPYQDQWSELSERDQFEKAVVFTQPVPLPSVVQFIDVRYDTTDDGEM